MRQKPTALILSLIILETLVMLPAQMDGRGQRTASALPLKQTAQNSTSWEGTYAFQEGGGRSAGGTGMFAEHTIRLYRQGGELLADIDAAGFQISRSLRCSSKVEGEKISLYFESYREDNITEPYRRGQLLLTLRHSSSGGRSRILTYWGAFRPALRAARSGRVYFTKIG